MARALIVAPAGEAARHRVGVAPGGAKRRAAWDRIDADKQQSIPEYGHVGKWLTSLSVSCPRDFTPKTHAVVLTNALLPEADLLSNLAGRLTARRSPSIIISSHDAP
jgi:hypothetical protein